MKVSMKVFCFALTLTLITLNMTTQAHGRKVPAEYNSLAARIRRFAPTALTANTAKLKARDRQALQKIIAAAKYFDPLYRRQVWSGNESLLAKLRADKSRLGRLQLHYFIINGGPWSRLDSNEPFIDGVPREKPPLMMK